MSAGWVSASQGRALVSVIVPTYDGERYVAEAVSSALAQSHRDLEVIVVDDGSSDRTLDVVARFTDRRVRVFQRPNGGVAAARNTGVGAARGEFVAFLDQDDAWRPEKLAEQLPRFAAPQVAIVGSLMTYIGPSGQAIGISGEIADHQQERIAALRLMPFAPSSMVVRSSVLREFGGFDEELAQHVAPVDDFDFVSRVAQRYRIVTVPRSLGYYRIHSEAGSFASFHAMRRAAYYLRARRDDPALTWDRWEATVRDGLSTRRRDRARYLYRLAGLRIASGRTVRGLAPLAGAVALAPRYSIRRLRRQRRRVT